MNLPLYQRLGTEFRHRIALGIWAEGSSVPSESELCREFNTSRGPVRQALADLRAEQLIEGGRGRPPRVRSAVPTQAVETFLSFTEWAESVGKIPGQVTRECARRPATPEIARELGLVPGTPVVSLLRLRLLDGEPTMVERSHFVLDVGRLLFDFDTDSGSTFRYLVQAGVDLNRARHTIDAVAADVTDASVLGIEAGSPLLRERRVTHDSNGVALEFAEDRYRAGTASFLIENTLSVNRHSTLARIPRASNI